MLRRTFNILWLLFATLWFAVIAPGHTRGVIRLDGSANGSVTSSAMSTCCTIDEVAPRETQEQQDHSDHPTKDKSHQHHPQDPAECCAICYLNSVLDIPPTPVFVTYCTGLLVELEPLEPVSLISHFVALIHQIRGPPIALA